MEEYWDLLKIFRIVFWHSDKLPYQRDVAEKISKIFAQLGEL